MTARIVLLVTSPRLPAGLLTAAAWDVVRAAPGLRRRRARAGRGAARGRRAVTVVEPDPERLLAAVGRHDGAWSGWPARPATRTSPASWACGWPASPALAELELMYGSWDPPGARLLDAVAVMDRLASPGGDPWKRAQTHRSLAPYLLEEATRRTTRSSADDLDALREELGDVLLQVVLHARLAEELPEGERWTVDDVAGGLVDKMVRRNPHVFAGAEAGATSTEITDELGADQAGREGPRLGAGRHRAEPARAGAGRQDPAAGASGPASAYRCRPAPDLGAGAAAAGRRRRAPAGADAEAALRRAALRIRRTDVRAAEREECRTRRVGFSACRSSCRSPSASSTPSCESRSGARLRRGRPPLRRPAARPVAGRAWPPGSPCCATPPTRCPASTPTRSTREDQVDHAILSALVERGLFELTEVREHEWNPLRAQPGPAAARAAVPPVRPGRGAAGQPRRPARPRSPTRWPPPGPCCATCRGSTPRRRSASSPAPPR